MSILCGSAFTRTWTIIDDMSDDPRPRKVDTDRTIHPPTTTIAAFVGPAIGGPVARPRLVTSIAEFADVFAESGQESSANRTVPNFLRHAVRTFFEEGGARAYVVRVNQGGDSRSSAYAAALQALAEVNDVSIVAAPGSTYVPPDAPADRSEADTIADLLISHAEQMRYRIAVLDSANGLDLQGVLAERGRLNSSYAAFYYPWVCARDPSTQRDILLPPCGFVAGMCARVDAQRGPWKAPANEPLRAATGLERTLDAAQSASLDAAGINVFRALPGQGVTLWGARTASDDPEWRYVNIRRYAAFLEQSIADGLQWAVFEPNNEQLWSAVSRTVEDFLLANWQSGGLAGKTPAEAYFVRCDRTTMTQQDIDNGRLICEVGVAVVRPAEFVIFRIGQWAGKPYRL
jgi:uncharacterized protein